ncbi:Autotransporter beta-domain protein [Burkholderia multivorans]
MKPITYRRKLCVHTFGRRSQRLSRLTALMLASIAAYAWMSPPAMAQNNVVAAGATSTGFIVTSGYTQLVMHGGTAIGTTVSSGGSQVVSGAASGTHVDNAGVQQIVNGGVATSTSVLTGEQYVGIGGTATSTSVNGVGAVSQVADVASLIADAVTGPGRFWLSISAAPADGVTVTVHSAGSATNATITPAVQYVDGGTATGNTIVAGAQVADSGGTVNSNTLFGGVQYLNGGGTTAKDTSLFGSVQVLDNGAKATSNTLYGSIQGVGFASSATSNTLDGSVQLIGYGGLATSNTLNGSVQDISLGGTAVSTTLNGSIQYVEPLGTASVTVVNSGSFQNVYGGTAISNTINNLGTQVVTSGGTATSNTVNSGGVEYVLASGTAAITVVSSGGTQNVAGGTAVSTTVSGGTQNVVSGGVATSNTIKGGLEYVGDGGTALVNIVNSGGVQYVDSGGGASATTINSGGYQQVYGGTATNNTVSGGTQTVASGGTAIGNTLSGGTQFVLTSGTASATSVGSGANQYVYGGTAIGNTIANSGTQTVASGGVASGNIVQAGGKQQIASGGTAIGNTLDGGTQFVLTSGTASATSVGSGANQYVYGGTANDNTIANSGTQTVAGGGVASGNTVDAGGMQQIAGGGTALGSTLDGGKQTVANGGSANTTAINAGGLQAVTSGGAGTSTTINSGGVQSVASGGTANVTTVNGGGVQSVTSGAVTTGTIINNGGVQSVNAGGVTSHSTVNGGGFQYIDGTVVNPTVNTRGTLMIGQGGTSGDLSGDVLNGGTVVFNRADAYTYGGAVSGSGTLVQAGNGMLVLNGVNTGFAGGTQVMSGTLKVGDSAHTSAFLGGDVTVYSGGTLRGDGTIGGNVVNRGTVMPGGSIGTTTILGNYAQAPGAMLTVEVTPTAHSLLQVMGNATLGGTLGIAYGAGASAAASVYAPGTIRILAASSVSGTFAAPLVNIVAPGASLQYVTPSVVYQATGVDLVLTPINTSIFTAVGSTAAQGAQSTTAIVLDRLGTLCRDNTSTDCAGRGNDLWFKATGSYTRIDSDTVSGFAARQYGFVAGYDHRIGRYTVGGTLAYTHADVTETTTPDSGTVDSVRTSVYGGTWFGPVNVAATVGIGYDLFGQKRPFALAQAVTATGDHHGFDVTAAAQASMPTPVFGSFTLVPSVGLRYAYLHGSAFGESGADGQSLSVGTDNIRSVQPYAGLALRYAFGSAQHPSSLEAKVGYAHELGTAGRSISVSAQDGTLFTATGASLPRNLLTAGFALTVEATKSLRITAGFDALINTGHASAKAGSLKVSYRF